MIRLTARTDHRGATVADLKVSVARGALVFHKIFKFVEFSTYKHPDSIPYKHPD